MGPEISSLYFCFRLNAEFISHNVSYSSNFGHILLQSKTPIILKIIRLNIGQSHIFPE